MFRSTNWASQAYNTVIYNRTTKRNSFNNLCIFLIILVFYTKITSIVYYTTNNSIFYTIE